MNRIERLLCVLCPFLLLALGAGCPGRPTGQNDDASAPPPGTVLKVAVVDDQPLAEALERLQDEWEAQSGVAIRVGSLSAEEFAAAGTPPDDVVICPSHQLGPAARDGWVLPVPDALAPGRVADWNDVFSLLRVSEATWDGRLTAVPFGSPVLVCYYRPDLLKTLGREPPATWREYGELASLLADRHALGDAAPPDQAPWCGALEPLGPGWAGVMLLARAAPYAVHRENYSCLFNIDTMEPLIAGPPFVRALEELVAAAGSGAADRLAMDPAAVRAAFWRGEAALAISWPTAADHALEGIEADFPVCFAELPGSKQVFDVGHAAWEKRGPEEDSRVPLLGVAGRIGLVTAGCPWPETAFRLLLWLTDEQWSLQVSTASPATTLFRESHLAGAEAWVERPLDASAATAYAGVVEQALSRARGLTALRLPGRAEYLAALDAAVEASVRGEKSPQESLDEAAAAWREITQKHGLDAQKTAYWQSLGL